MTGYRYFSGLLRRLAMTDGVLSMTEKGLAMTIRATVIRGGTTKQGQQHATVIASLRSNPEKATCQSVTQTCH